MAANAVAQSLASNRQAGRIEVAARIPWIDTRLAIGDRISSAGSRGLQLNGRLEHSAARDPDWSVVGKTYLYSDSAIETHLRFTRRLVRA